jgi:hypothetical protein
MYRKFVLPFLVMFSQSVSAECEYLDKTISPLDSLAIIDPYLVSEATNYYMSKGISREESAKMARQSDWTYVVVSCLPTYSANLKTEQDEAAPMSMLKVKSYELVPISHQIEFQSELLTKATNHEQQ